MPRLSAQALRQRVSRIEKKMDAGKKVREVDRALVTEYRRTHKRYNTTKRALAEMMDIGADDYRDAEEQERMRLLEEGAEGGTPSTVQSDTLDASPSVSIDDIADDVASFASEVMDVPSVTSGVCPVGGCRAPLVDGQLRCGKCGANVRPDLCTKCKDPFVDGEQFCRRDGMPRPTSSAATVQVTKNGQVVAVEHPIIKMWSKKNTKWVADGVDLILEKSGMEKLDDEERDQLVDALVPVLNKRLPASGAYAEEIRLAVIFAGMMLPRCYVRFVIMPDRERAQRRKDAESAARIAAMQAKPPASAPEPTATTIDLKVGR